ncbi:PQQ-dependent sugar dehydrogenase [Martelella soudanensis]|uniref:PQQ-dependent sugar dehydrogenase n=1 Tax=unclassified Martelella TaxID=2629616 RepID=UPI0015DDA215|nr:MULTISPECIES: PQQ-dependent sugar dehydrogenase [unclassified Martelella]
MKATPVIAGMLAALAFSPWPAAAQQTTPPLAIERIADGLAHPWAVEVLPDGDYLVTERPGRLTIISPEGAKHEVAGLPDLHVGGQGGLLDVALDPAFDDNGRIYFTASVSGRGGQGTAVYRATLDRPQSRLENVGQIFAMNRFSGTSRHFGSRIAIDGSGNLFFGIGDRGEGERAQDPADHAGSILHIGPDGGIPEANPTPAGWQPEIWSIGHRNPQGIAIDPETGTLYTVEHGARGGDEINTPRAGQNHGWPEISYGVHYSGAKIGQGTEAPGLEQPLYYWDPSIAPGAIAVYRGEMFPEWDGDFLVTALKDQLLAHIGRDETGLPATENRLFANEFGRLRDVKVAPDGSVLLVSDEPDGSLLRVYRAD